MGTLIDTSVVVDAERALLDLDAIMAGGGEFCLSAISVSELLHGVHRASRGRTRAVREAFVEQLLSRLPVVSFDVVVARVHARVWADLASRGVAVGERDLLIGATAIAHGHDVATRDARSFPKIPGLTVTMW